MRLCFIQWRERGAIRTVVSERIKDSLRQREDLLTTPGGRKMRKDRDPVPRGQTPRAPRIGIKRSRQGCAHEDQSLCYIILPRNSTLASS